MARNPSTHRQGRTCLRGGVLHGVAESGFTRTSPTASAYTTDDEWINTGNSLIVDPSGKILAGPLNKAEGILYADVDLKMLRGTRWNLDVAGHYARPDAFHLTIRTTSTPILTLQQGTPDSSGAEGKEKVEAVHIEPTQ